MTPALSLTMAAVRYGSRTCGCFSKPRCDFMTSALSLTMAAVLSLTMAAVRLQGLGHVVAFLSRDVIS